MAIGRKSRRKYAHPGASEAIDCRRVAPATYCSAGRAEIRARGIASLFKRALQSGPAKNSTVVRPTKRRNDDVVAGVISRRGREARVPEEAGRERRSVMTSPLSAGRLAILHRRSSRLLPGRSPDRSPCGCRDVTSDAGALPLGSAGSRWFPLAPAPDR